MTTNDQRMVFREAMESLFKRLPEGSLTPELRLAVRKLGVDTEHFLPAYPSTVWAAVVECVAQRVFPGVTLEKAHWQLGRRLVEGWRETLVGKAAFEVLRIIGPRRALDRTAKAFRNGNNYTESSLVKQGEQDFELWMNDVETRPAFTAGILAAGMEAVGARGVHVEPIKQDARGMTFRVRWEG